MIVPDINLLLYANITAFARHESARRWWERAIAERRGVGIPAPTLFGFIRLATHRRVFDPPMAVEDAIGRAEAWLANPHVFFLTPGSRHLEIAFGLMRALGAASNLTTDVQLAAYAIENQAELHSNDTDFGRFKGLRWVNPLEP